MARKFLRTREEFRMNTDRFVEKARSIFPQYKYDLVDYKNPKTKITVFCTEHGPFNVLPYSILSGHKCNKCARLQASETRAALGLTVPLSERDGFAAYRKRVNNLTSTSYKRHSDKVNPDGLTRSRSDYNVDHVFSVLEGFKQNIPPEMIGHWTNLRMLSVKENRIKDSRCDKTLDQLVADLVSHDLSVRYTYWFQRFQQELLRDQNCSSSTRN